MSSLINEVVVTGPCELRGEVSLQGSKNSALSLIPTLLLGEGKLRLNDVPYVTDILHMVEFVKSLGIEAVFSENQLTLSVPSKAENVLTEGYTRLSNTRTTFYFIPYLLKYYGRAELPNPGGCKLGARKSDFLFDALKRFGAEVEVEGERIVVEASALKAIEYKLPYPSQSVSTILLSLATISTGTSVLENISLNPEIEDKLNLLQKMGVSIERPGKRAIVVSGGSNLSATEFDVMPDRVVAATWIAAAGITGGWVEMSEEAEPFLQAELEVFQRFGLVRRPTMDGKVRYSFEGESFPVSVTTGPYPMFSTDIQPLATVLMVCRGAVGSIIKEMVFDQRFNYVRYLNEMGSNIEVHSLNGHFCPSGKPAHVAKIGSSRWEKLRGGGAVTATDLRAGMALLLAALAAEGRTSINDAYQIYRGYENLVETLRSLGAKIEI
jgi:UDP-N-acetylglucosamine 1-carboxyvinyltransferase